MTTAAAMFTVCTFPPPPTDDSLYESPEPFLTDDTSGSGGPALPRLSLLFATSLVFLAS